MAGADDPTGVEGLLAFDFTTPGAPRPPAEAALAAVAAVVAACPSAAVGALAPVVDNHSPTLEKAAQLLRLARAFLWPDLISNEPERPELVVRAVLAALALLKVYAPKIAHSPVRWRVLSTDCYVVLSGIAPQLSKLLTATEFSYATAELAEMADALILTLVNPFVAENTGMSAQDFAAIGLRGSNELPAWLLGYATRTPGALSLLLTLARARSPYRHAGKTPLLLYTCLSAWAVQKCTDEMAALANRAAELCQATQNTLDKAVQDQFNLEQSLRAEVNCVREASEAEREQHAVALQEQGATIEALQAEKRNWEAAKEQLQADKTASRAAAAADAAMAALLAEEEASAAGAAKAAKSKKKKKKSRAAAASMPLAAAAAEPPAVSAAAAPAAAASSLPPCPPPPPPAAAAVVAALIPLPAYLTAALSSREAPAPAAELLPPLPMAAPPPPPPAAPSSAARECCVCLDDVALGCMHVLFPCGHRCMCQACAEALMAADAAARRCPKCRAAVLGSARVFDE